MITRITLSLAIALSVFVGTGAVSTAEAAKKYFDINSGTWKTEPPVRRHISQRKVPQKFKRRNVTIQTTQAPGTVVIHTDEKFLYYITGKNRAIRYGIGVGREGFGWNGEVSIKRKAEWPTWTPPAEMRIRERAEGRELPVSMPGGIDNPLGARALYLYKGNRDTLYRIHGTNQPWSIGLNLSSGCIRMENKDVEHLYDRVKIGTKVVVIGPGESPVAYIRPNNNPLAALFNGG